MTKKFRVGDKVWCINKDAVPKAVLCVVREIFPRDDRMKVYCVDRSDCEGHIVFPHEVHETEIEACEAEIQRQRGHIETDNDEVSDYYLDIARRQKYISALNSQIALARSNRKWEVDFEEEEVYADVDGSFATREEAYAALAEDLKERYENAERESGAGVAFIVADGTIYYARNTVLHKHAKDGEWVEFNDYDGRERLFKKGFVIFASREDAGNYITSAKEMQTQE